MLEQGLRGQPTSGVMGKPLLVARFRRRCPGGTGAIPLAMTGERRSVGFQVPGTMTSKVCDLSPAGHRRTVQTRID